MATYRYIATTLDGKKVKGKISGDNPKQLRKKLKEQGLLPIDFTELLESNDTDSKNVDKGIDVSNNKTGFLSNIMSPRISSAALCLITRQLSTLISSGIPIEEALRAIAKQSDNQKQTSIITKVRDNVCEGLPLSDAMKKFPKVFNDLYTAMVSAGEKSGQLDRVLERLADHTEQSQEMKGKIIQAMVYPIILTLVAVGVIGLLLSSVVPKVVEQFIHMKSTLPTSTKILIALSDFIKGYGFFIVLFIVGIIVLFNILLRNDQFKRKYHELIMRLPIIGKISLSLNTSRFAQTLSILHASAVPLLEAMKVSGETLTNVIARERIKEATDSVREGKALSRALQETKLFTPMMLHMISSGEKSGELESMLSRAASQQTNDFKRNVSIAISVFEPLLIVAMAVAVLFIVISILQPLLQMNSMVGR